MGKPHKGFTKLASFAAISYGAANKRFKLGKSDAPPPKGFDIAVEDVFGDEPEEVFVHDGSVTHATDLAIGATGDYAGMYVIDGDLEVSGMLELTQIDGGSILYVTGNVRARHLSVEQEAQLWVGGDLHVAELLLAGVSDAGGLAVKGATTATALIVTDSANLGFGKKPKARIIERYQGLLDEDDFKQCELAEHALTAPFNTEDLEHEELVKAVRQGRVVLRSPA